MWLLAGLFGGALLAGVVGWGAAGIGMPGSPRHHAGMMSSGMDGGHCAGCSGAASDAAPPRDNRTVVLRSSQFSPTTLTVRVGETVTWVNRDGYVHTVTSDRGAELDSGDLEGGDTFQHRFTRAGTFEYHCEPHAYANAAGDYRGMVARIVVERA